MYDPLSFWRENQYRFPAITALARDYLAIPATGARVERLFNTARDICHYRRGSLKSQTIEELMLYLCTSRFDLEVQDTKEFEQFFGSDDLQILVEEAAQKPDGEEPDIAEPSVIDVDAISDTEEQGDRSGSRDLIDVDDDDDDDDGVDNEDATITAAPSHAAAAPSRVRTSGRKRRHVEDDLYEHYQYVDSLTSLGV